MPLSSPSPSPKEKYENEDEKKKAEQEIEKLNASVEGAKRKLDALDSLYRQSKQDLKEAEDRRSWCTIS
jgi:predicted  nucleic acid-binding Zn-ribbon protein